MSTEIKFKAIATHGRFSVEKGGCIGRIVHNDSLTMDGIATEFAKYAKIGEHEARFYASLFADYLVKAIGEGKRLNLGAFSLYLTMKGQIDGANGSFDPKRNRLELNIKEQEPLAAALGQLEPVNATLENETLRINSIIDASLKKEGKIVLGSRTLVAGATFLVDDSRDDEGVWLEDSADEKILRARVISSTATTLDFVFPGKANGVKGGTYRLAVYTRMGAPKRPAPAVARKKVQVVAS